MDSDTREKLRRDSVAIPAMASCKRGSRNQTYQDVHSVARKGRNLARPADTLRYIPAHEDPNTLAELRNPEHPQRLGVEIPSLSVDESFTKPTSMLYRNMLAMETEEKTR